MVSNCKWRGCNSGSYPFDVHPFLGGYKTLPNLFVTSVPAIYIFARLEADGYKPIYIGQTTDISGIFVDPYTMNCISKYKETHIHIRVNNSNKYDKLREERDIVEFYKPPLNNIILPVKSSTKIPDWEFHLSFTGNHSFNLWKEVGISFICPVCKINKFEL